MNRAVVFMNWKRAGIFLEVERGGPYQFAYDTDYEGPSISMTMPLSTREYVYDEFPPFFDGLLPEGYQLEALLKNSKIDRNDYFRQLIVVGKDLVGAVTVEEGK